MPTHKKAQDRDKYYNLAKEQGFRSRAAFKLIQINKRFDILTKSKVCIDLCAAPGGWCQVAAKHMPQGSIIIGVDLLPIRLIRNVKTFVADITTAECRKLIRTELNGWKADVVLCDGAPNIGSAYSKDAYVQNELVLAALKTATDHLNQGGTFCTKIYRSVDYNALIWVFQQLFEDVQTIKPSSSRSQSSEIFLVCMKYTAPKYIDPKLLDPNHVFKEVKDAGLQSIDVLHKKYDQHNNRHRTGYDTESLGVLLHQKCTVLEFIASADPVRLLTDMNSIVFTKECEKYKTHELTTKDAHLVSSLSDLKVLSKTDFRKIVRWRTAIKEAFRPAREPKGKSEDASDGSGSSEESEIDLDEEFHTMQEKVLHAKKKEKKKARREAAKTRERQVLGISNNAFEDFGDQELFSMKSIKGGNINVDSDDNSDDAEAMESYFLESQGIVPKVGGNKELIEGNEDLDEQLNEDYKRYISRKGKQLEEEDGAVVKSTKASKREASSEGKMKKRQSDDDMLQDKASGIDSEDADSGDEEEDDDEDEEGNDFADLESRLSINKGKGEVSADKSDLWFSHPLFKKGQLLNDASIDNSSRIKTSSDGSDGDDGEEMKSSRYALEQIASMPKTDKEVRSEKRKRALERRERSQGRKSRALEKEVGVDESDKQNNKKEIEIVRSAFRTDEDDDHLDIETVKYRDMIAKGMGHSNDDSVHKGLEIVQAEDPYKRHDDRSYDSDSEEYDEDDKATTLALGTMMLRKSKQKAIVDASYNRYSWNDSKDLPEWFMDDEYRHNKPLPPVPAALLSQVKGNFSQHAGHHEIKKVAEARMRKRKRALAKLKTARKTATAAAENSEMSERQKVKAISSALKAAKINKPGKVYVVAKKQGGASMGTKIGDGKGKLKFVDRRMKKDLRAEKAREKRKGGGKKRARKAGGR